MLSGVPFRFNTPVTGDLTLTASWVLPSTPDAFVLRAGLLNITLDSYGRVTNLVSSLDGTDYYCPGPDEKLRSLISLVADYTIEEPTSLTYDEEAGVLTFGLRLHQCDGQGCASGKGKLHLPDPDGTGKARRRFHPGHSLGTG